jgi:hypothetical protein
MLKRFPGWGSIAAAALVAASSVSLPASEKPEDDPVAAAIDVIRGRDLDKMSAAEKKAFADSLDQAWKVLREHRKQALPAVRAALAEEQKDGFRIIDLSRLLVALDEKLLGEAAGSILKADPNTYPDGYFWMSVEMSATHCKGCLPAVLRMLELKRLDSYIVEHALPVNVDLGILFTIGQYGDAALDGVRESLSSEDCIVRGNAALAVSLLLPEVEPPALAKMAIDDPCESGRRRAWEALGAFDSPALPRLATQRLDATDSPSVEERKAIASGLSNSFSRTSLAPLERLATDADPSVAKEAKEGHEGIEKEVPTIAELKAKAGSAPPAFRSKIQRLLKKAVADGHFEFDGERTDLLPALKADDFPLLNQARAAVLARVSDECIYEYMDLSFAARAVRLMRMAPVGPASAVTGSEP